MRSVRYSGVNNVCFEGCDRTATTSRSTNDRLRRMRSECPFVMGSKLPAYSATRGMMNYYSGRQEVDSGHGGMICEDIENVGAKQRTLSPYSCPLIAVGQRPLYRIAPTLSMSSQIIP